MVKRAAGLLVFLFVLLLLPSAAYAQAAITGVVKDTSGAILPGVTVEAASPVLIEKVRSVVTDATGQYRVVNLRPGTYSVTFSLPGFSTVKREGIELTGTFVATVNGDLKVGALEETITVTGETPIVDVQSAKVQQTISKDVLAAIPSSRLASSVLNLIPGMVGNTTDVGGSRGMEPLASYGGSIHGSRTNDGRLMSDGLSVAFNNAGGGMYMANMGGAQEIAVNTSGGLGESEVAGVITNVIPRDGGNNFGGTIFASGANGAMQGDNYTQKLKDRGLTTPSQILKTYDFNPTGGGRIIRDQVWFYNTFRLIGAHNTVPGMFINTNAGDITKWTYDPDLSKQAFVDNLWGSSSVRLAWQATQRNKINFFYDLQWRHENKLGGGLATTAPEAHARVWNWPSEVHQVSWSSPLTSRLLLDAGYGDYLLTYRLNYLRPGFDERLIQATEQAGVIPGLNYRAPANYSDAATGTRSWRAAISYVTGAHNMKFGYQGGWHAPRTTNIYPNNFTNFRFSSGVANRVTQNAAHEVQFNRHLIPNAVYAQDSWTAGRLTLQGGVRYDMMVTRYPEQSVSGPGIPVPIVYPAGSVRGVRFHDITPRMGAAYDLFGNGKTALKVNLGHYPSSVTGGDYDANPLARLAVTTTTRSWTDTNKNYAPDCDLLNPAKNGECGAMANQNFGKNIFSNNFDPAIMSGWGVRADQWDFGVSVQQEILPRVSVNVGYFRRWYGKFTVTDNLAVTPADFDVFSIVAPVDARLPNGGGYTIGNLYDVKSTKFGLVDNLVTAASNYGKQIENWHGVDATVSARMQNSLIVQGGMSTGRTLTDNCEIRAKLPEIAPTNPFCRVVQPMLYRWNGLAAYTIPRVAMQVSATWRSNPQGARETNPGLAANRDVPNAQVVPSLGRNLAGNTANVTVNLVPPATVYGDRVTNLDMRVAKVLRFGRTRTQIGVDIYNITNTDAPLTFNETFVPGGQWLTPLTIQPARFVKISAQFDF